MKTDVLVKHIFKLIVPRKAMFRHRGKKQLRHGQYDILGFCSLSLTHHLIHQMEAVSHRATNLTCQHSQDGENLL